MVASDIMNIIQGWYRLAGVFSLILPSGWLGRPYDNQHNLTYLELRPHKLLLELDDQLLLIFTDIETVKIEGSELVLTDFKQCVFDWQGYGDLRPHVDVYKTGAVKLVPPIGTTIAG